MKPFIVLFQTPNSKYSYDVNKSELLSVSDASYTYLSNCIEGTDCNATVPPAELLALMNNGYLMSTSAVQQIGHVYSKYLDTFLKRKLARIILQLTQNCNLRCKYCVYSEADEFHRSHSTKHMTWETAKRAVDFLRDHSVDSPIVNIAFYGGEPLLEFPLMQDIIEYSKSCFRGKKLTFNMTSNGTLINDDIIKYLEKQDISLMISLDGPKEINDLNRVFADGSGTFDIVCERLNRIRDLAPDYASKLLISMVMDPRNDYDCINEIYLDDAAFQKQATLAKMVEYEYNKDAEYSSEYIWKMEYHNFLALLAEYGRYPKADVAPVASNWVTRIKKDFADFGNLTPLRQYDVPGGPCIPGLLRLFIDADGFFYPCERVSEKSLAMRIGSLYDGIDVDRTRKLLNVGKLTAEECKGCWCIRHCDMCAKKADNGSAELSAATKLSNCAITKESVRRKIQQCILLSEIPRFYARQMSRERNTK